MRRLRRTEALRSLVRETHLHPGALIQPVFLCSGEGVRREIGSMPGVFNLSLDEAVKEAEACAALGIGGLLLFGLPEEKDEQGSGAWAADGGDAGRARQRCCRGAGARSRLSGIPALSQHRCARCRDRRCRQECAGHCSRNRVGPWPWPQRRGGAEETIGRAVRARAGHQ